MANDRDTDLKGAPKKEAFHQAAEDIALRTAISDHNPDASEGVSAWIERRQPRFNEGRKGDANSYAPGRGVLKPAPAGDAG